MKSTRLKGLKMETVEKIADLWNDKKFQELVKVLNITLDNWKELLLRRRTTSDSWQLIRSLQDKADGILLVLKTVEDAYKEVNNLGDK